MIEKMADMEKKQSRKWLLTINNPKEKGFTHEKIKLLLQEFKQMQYWCMSDETGEEGTYHTHVYFYNANPVSFKTVKNKFPSAHIDQSNGTSEENRDYVFKQGKWENDKKNETNLRETQEEYGECPHEEKGKRNDLAALQEMIADGMSTNDIMTLCPKYSFDLEKIDRMRQVILQERFRKTFRELEVIYIFGETGTGKTRGVMEKHDYDVFRVTDYDHPFDGYQGQDAIIFEEFRSDLKISEMLNYLDGYPLELPSRYSNKIACFTKIYIITNVPLKKQYRKVQLEQPETFKALLRRIHEVHEYEGKQVIKMKTADYMTVDDMKYFRTDGEIENILNFAFYKIDAKKETSSAAASERDFALEN